MDNLGAPTSSVGKHPRRFWTGLLLVKSLIGRLLSLISVTEQDLENAGVYLNRPRD